MEEIRIRHLDNFRGSLNELMAHIMLLKEKHGGSAIIDFSSGLEYVECNIQVASEREKCRRFDYN